MLNIEREVLVKDYETLCRIKGFETIKGYKEFGSDFLIAFLKDNGWEELSKVKIEYTRDDKKALCKKYNENRANDIYAWSWLSLRDRIAVAEFQLEILNPDSKSCVARKAYRKWVKLLNEFKIELLKEEGEQILTSKGTKVEAVRYNNEFIVWCKCNGTGKSPYNNICTHCYGKGIKTVSSLKEVTKSDYLSILKDKYYKLCKKKHMFPHPNADNMDIPFFEGWLRG